MIAIDYIKIDLISVTHTSKYPKILEQRIYNVEDFFSNQIPMFQVNQFFKSLYRLREHYMNNK